MDCAAGAHRPVGSHPFVGAASEGIGWLEEVHPHVEPWNVVPDRKARLEQKSWPPRLGHNLAIDDHLDVPRGVEHVDSMARIAGMDEDFVVLFVPGVHEVPTKH